MFDFDGLIDRANPRWKRAHSLFLDLPDALELVSFVEAIGGYLFAKRVFAWHGQAEVDAYASIASEVLEQAQPFIHQWHEQFGVDQGLAILRAMQADGFRRGKLSPVTKMALKALRKRGMAIADIAKATGLSREQVKTGCDVRFRGKTARVAAFSSLAMGTKSFS